MFRLILSAKIQLTDLCMGNNLQEWYFFSRLRWISLKCMLIFRKYTSINYFEDNRKTHKLIIRKFSYNWIGLSILLPFHPLNIYINLSIWSLIYYYNNIPLMNILEGIKATNPKQTIQSNQTQNKFIIKSKPSLHANR